MATRDEFIALGDVVAKSVRHDETGRLHEFFAYSVPITEEAILKIAGSIQGTRAAKNRNIEFFKDPNNMISVLPKEIAAFGGRTQVTAMEYALFGMRQLQSFLESDCETQSTPSANRSGKSRARIHKHVCISIGKDPSRPGYEYPFDCSASPLIQWSVVPAKNTRMELMDLQRHIPPSVRYKLYTAKGDERIEFEPTKLRPHGAIHRIKSYSMPVDQFQREAVHVIGKDEKGPQYIEDECRMRLLSTGGWEINAMALYEMDLWLYERNKRFDVQYRGLKEGKFGWYSWRQVNCPWLDQERVADEAEKMDEDTRAARCDGDPRLLEGSAYFKPAEMIQDLWKKYSRNPEWEMRFSYEGKPEFRPYSGKKGWRIYEQPVKGATYAIGADVAEGLGGDHDSSTSHVIRVDTNTVVAVYQSNEIEADEFGLEMYLAGRAYNDAVIAIEKNIEFAATHLWLKRYNYPRIFRSMSFSGHADPHEDAYGWRTDARAKNWMLEELRQTLKATRDGKRGELVLYDSPTFEEISDFGYLKEPRRKSFGLAGLSGHDDLVISLAIAVQATKQAERPKTIGVEAIAENSPDARILKITKKLALDDSRRDRPLIKW